MGSVLKRTAAAFFSTLGVLILFGLLLDKLENTTHSFLYAVFGWGAIVFTGLVGTPVHELGHWLGCKLFGFHVSDVALFRPVAGQYDGILGYVQYSYDAGSLWHRLGCFITGIAPLLFGGVVILLLLRFLTPEVYRYTSAKISDASQRARGPLGVLWAAFSGFWGGLFRLRGWGILRGLLCFYMVLSISMHMSLSPQDLIGASAGFLLVLGLFLVYGVVTALIGTDYRPLAIRTASMLSAFLCIGLFFCLLMLAISLLVFSL